MPRGAVLRALLLLLCTSVPCSPAPAPPVVAAALGSAAPRSLPRLGLGTELCWFSANDSRLAQASAWSGSQVLRYPGGTPSNFW